MRTYATVGVTPTPSPTSDFWGRSGKPDPGAVIACAAVVALIIWAVLRWMGRGGK